MFPKPFVCGVKEQADIYTGVKFLSACLALGVIDLILHFYYLQTTEFFPVVFHLPHYFLPLCLISSDDSFIVRIFFGCLTDT